MRRFSWEPVRRGGRYPDSPRFTELRPADRPGPDGVSESPVIACEPFDRAVLSWNGVGVGRLEMRVRVGEDFSPYLPLAVLDGTGQRSLRRSEYATLAPDPAAAPLADVEVDTLVLRGGARANGFQVRARGGDLSGLRTLAVTHYRRDDRRYTTAPADRGAWGTTLPVPERSQRDAEDPAIRPEVCSPTSLSMVLEYYGLRRRTIEVCREVFDPASRIYGNWCANTAAASRLLGGSGWAAVVKMAGFDEAEREIAARRPVVLSHRWNRGELTNAPISRSNGHLIVCVGFTTDGDVVVNDPAAKAGEVRRVYKRAELFHTWQEGGDGIAYMVRPA